MFNGRKLVGICTSELDQKFHAHMLERVIKELINLDFYVMVFGSDSDMYSLNESDIADAAVFDLMHLDRIDLVIIFSETIKQKSISNHIAKRAHMAGVPVLSVGIELEDCFNVVYDKDSAFEKMVRHIVEYHGLNEVNFISGPKGNEVAERRLQIYRGVLEDNDILFEESRVGYGDFWYEPTRRVMEEFVRPDKVLPEAIICANDSMAVAVCDFLRERHIRVPDEVIVAGVDGIDDGIKHTPSITTCARDDVNDAKTIASIADGLCLGKTAVSTTVLEYHMQLSQSCGCQQTHLFDPDAVIGDLNYDLAGYHSDMRFLAEMREKFLKCENDDEFWNILGQYMPDGSFICINSDLEAGKPLNKKNYVEDFTEELRAIVKTKGEARKCECYLKNVVPEAGKDAPHKMPVVVMPLHFSERTVGYMGAWIDAADRLSLERIVNFLLSLDSSAAYILCAGK